MISYKSFETHTEIAHFCTSRQGGVSVGNFASNNLNPFTGDQPAHYAQNKQILCNRLGIEVEKLIIPFQTHGTEIREINDTFFNLSPEEKTAYLHGVDALITNLPHVCIGITTADCVPLLFFDPEKKIIAAAHAGWRGTCARIAEKVISEMHEKHNCRAQDIIVSIGPSISAEVYNVGEELVEDFQNAGFETDKIFQYRDGAIFLDLWKANQLSLKKAGILPENIELAGICTFTEHERFFSARRLGIKSGRMMSGIMLVD
ncbi:MAG: peptidoglycan editing factor PgeF [Paludibacter sp.]|nr:peptidoglycan editing factor PgeF [Paludibacter sp.]